MTKARDISKLLSTANGKIAGENLDVSFENITDTGTEGTKVASGTNAQRGTTQGQLRFNTDTGLAEYYTGTAFKSIDAAPIVSSIDVTEVDSQAGGNQTIVITGSGFSSGATVTFVGASGTDFNASSVTFNSVTQLTAVAPKASFLNAQEPYGVKVENPSGLSATLASQINVDSAPTFDVASGSLGTLSNANRASSNLTSVTATDAEGDAITFSKISGTLPTGITFNSDGTFSGTADAETSNTTYTFTIRATANSKTSDRQYTITVNAPIATGGTENSYTDGGINYISHTFLSSGTFTLNNTTALDFMIVAGGGAGGIDGEGDAGGGGAGGVIVLTNQSTSASTYTITVGNGGVASSPPSSSTDGQNSVAFSNTAIGGGTGGTASGTTHAGRNGGSGGGGGGETNTASGTGTSGQGNNGGTGDGTPGASRAGGGGGGAGASGGNASPGTGGVGGIGIQNNFRTGSNIYYAGGGGGGAKTTGSLGGLGGGGRGSNSTAGNQTSGTANTGGGGGGGTSGNNSNGGSGIVVIRYAA
jgi:hypothetical protein